jgi:hypothetical protein
MGLDQYAFVTDKKGDKKIAQWRKHNRLQGWMENLWESKVNAGLMEGGGEFNCVKLELTLKDIEALEGAIKTRTLPYTSGFFFGSDSYEDSDPASNVPYYDYPADIAFIKKAKKALKAGNKVFYSCWW